MKQNYELIISEGRAQLVKKKSINSMDGAELILKDMTKDFHALELAARKGEADQAKADIIKK